MTANIYEGKNDWKSAVYLRHKAERLFPHNLEKHRGMLGRDYYSYAVYLENKGDIAKALLNYKKAMTYLNPSSEYYDYARDGYDILREKN